MPGRGRSAPGGPVAATPGAVLSCTRTHVLLPVSVLARRADCVEVIGAALVGRAEGRGHRPIAAALGVPECTVRGWLRRFTARAAEWRDRFTVLLVALDPDPAPPAARWVMRSR